MKKINLHKKFIFALFSSWSLAFTGIFFAKYINIANSKILIYTLLASGATTPFQLFFNECIAPTEAFKNVSNTKIPSKSFFLGIFLQAIAIIAFLHNTSSKQEIVIFTIFFSFGSYFSFQYVKNYYKFLTLNFLNDTQNIALSSIPGVAVILLYGIAAISKNLGLPNWEEILYLNSILPQLTQLLALLAITRKLDLKYLKYEERHDHQNIFRQLIYLTLLMIAAIILINSRNEIAKSSTDSMAVLIVALNALGTIINTITRASFLNSTNAKSSSKFTFIVALFTLIIAYFFYININIPITAMIFALISVSSIIEYARRNL